MPSYDEIKEKFLEHKQKFVLVVCFVLVFLIGFGTGRFERNTNLLRNQARTHYTTTTAVSPPKQATPAAPAVAGATTPGDCPVKGNISSGGKKIYHVAGGAFYKTVKPEQCFNTETEALAAGFVKSQR